MANIKSLIPSLPVKATARSAHWSCFLIAAAALQLTACGGGGDASPGAQSLTVVQKPAQGAASCDSQINDTPEKLLACVTLPAVRAHQSELAEIAKANNGTRMAGTAGYDASVDYARKVFEDAGYRVTLQPFEFPLFNVVDSSLQEAGLPAAQPIPHKVLDYSGSGDVTARVSFLRGPSGCAASDFTGFLQGNIALIRRGACTMTSKVVNAIAAGATGVVIYNHVQGDLMGGLSVDAPEDIPAVMVSKAMGEQLLELVYGGLQLHLKTETSRTLKTTHNVLAESVDGDPAHITMVGAHLDSVGAGAGSNDNGSGVAALLETARQMARVKPVNQLRFALWSAEEEGLLGSKHYTKNLDATQKASIGMYLNFDMIGSPNYVFYVYAGDGSAGPKAISSPQASAQMIDILGDFYTQRGLQYKRLNIEARSDHQSFADIGIPFAGVFTGAEEIKSQQDAEIWGGRAGVAYDPCYHQSCDDLSNNADFALDVNTDAVAYSTLYFAMNKVAK